MPPVPANAEIQKPAQDCELLSAKSHLQTTENGEDPSEVQCNNGLVVGADQLDRSEEQGPDSLDLVNPEGLTVPPSRKDEGNQDTSLTEEKSGSSTHRPVLNEQREEDPKLPQTAQEMSRERDDSKEHECPTPVSR